MKKQIAVMSAAFLAVCFLLIIPFIRASEFSGPEKLVLPNVHQPRSDWNFLVWYQGAGREWLRISGDSSAPDLAEQWKPAAVTIESTREPVIVRTQAGWQIQFK